MLERKCKTNVQHYGKPDNLWACFEVAERRMFCYSAWLQSSLPACASLQTRVVLHAVTRLFAGWCHSLSLKALRRLGVGLG